MVFFKQTNANGSNALLVLQKSNKKAFQSVSSVPHVLSNTDNDSLDPRQYYLEKEDDDCTDTLKNITIDLKDFIC